MIELKRRQNSLLNVSRLPPEILGRIFQEVFTPNGFDKRPVNFLLVCHYWYEVALHTPEIWSFWGNTLEEWTRRHLQYPETPLDLVLDEGKSDEEPLDLDASVENALRKRASRDTIRLVHLRTDDSDLLESILYALTGDKEEIRYSSVESFILQDEGDAVVDASDFFAHGRFPQLRHLDLTNCAISSWDHLVSQTRFLTTLVLHLTFPSPTPTTPQLLSLLTSNPVLQRLALTSSSVPNDRDKGPSQVPLPYLKELELAGKCKDVSMLLNRLDHPGVMDYLGLTLSHRAAGDISEIAGGYLREYLRRRGTSQDGLGLYFASGDVITFHIGNAGVLPRSTPLSQEMVSFVTIDIDNVHMPPDESPEETILTLMESTPLEEVTYLRTRGRPPAAMGKVYDLLPNLRMLHSEGIRLSSVFPEPTRSGEDRYPSPSLRHVFLSRIMTGGDWTPLTTFLGWSFRTSSEKRLDSLEIVSTTRMSPEVQEDIKISVHEFKLVRPDSYPPLRHPPTQIT